MDDQAVSKFELLLVVGNNLRIARRVLRVKLAADKTGRLTAAQAYLAYEAGAYPGSPVGAGAMCVFACYDVATFRIPNWANLGLVAAFPVFAGAAALTARTFTRRTQASVLPTKIFLIASSSP